ncbi:hypothetical protein SAMN02745150_01101 [Brevinema andersonii]|uniref:Uncharacterized protein n=1 Tax=Brevinema andersonii TaxID=34097 RepID=A0A1I1EMA0_BREAD|nr:hypothetical protein [Brevinema andersonii]SFB86050.1 hypothetical protein SAMN02745150_01101 [Brevinema andersonii]
MALESSKKISWPLAIGILVVMGLALYPLVENYKYNDHSKNWLNHDYGKNLLSSTEEYSVFMTEGGDNQVFSSLYFTYAEKLRQDLFPYDQKGNIYKKIYGDLRYVSLETLNNRQNAVDRGLFTGEEPFYEDIRSPEPPYFVPYALGKPSTYLTWKRPNPQELGDFYYKNYGQMYKVQPIRYALVDLLQITKESKINYLRKHLTDVLGRPINDQEWNRWTNELIQEGLVSRDGANLVFKRMYHKPFVKDPRETFITRWDDIENIEYLDYLSREIITSYAYELVMFLSDEIKNYEYLYEREDTLYLKTEFKQKLDELWDEVWYYADLAVRTGHDSSSILHNLGIFYLTINDNFMYQTNDYTPQAIEVWEKVTKQFPYSWATYNVLFWSYLQQAFKYPAQATQYLEAFDDQLKAMTNSMKHWKTMKKNLLKSQPYQAVAALVNMRDNFTQLGGETFAREAQNIQTLLQKPADEIDINQVISYLTKVINRLIFSYDRELFENFIANWTMLWNKKKNDPIYRQWHIRTLGDIAGYREIVDQNLYRKTLNEASSLLPTVAKTQEDLATAISMSKIAEAVGDQRARNHYMQQFNRDAKNILTPQDYDQIQKQMQNYFNEKL